MNKSSKRKTNLQQSSTNILRGTSCVKTAHSARERERHLKLTLFHFVSCTPLLGHKALHLPNSVPKSIPISTSLNVTSDKEGLSWELRIPQDNPSQTKNSDISACFVFFPPSFSFCYAQSAVVCLGTAVWLSKFVLIKALWRHDLSIFGSEAAVSLLSVWSRSPLLRSVWLL